VRVLVTADAVGGVWTHALGLARALAPWGVETVLATMGPAPSAAQAAAASAIPGLDLRVSTARLEWMEDPWADVDAAGVWLQDIAAESRPALVHLNGYAHAALDWQVPVVVGAHSCVCSWWRAVHHEDPPPSWDTYRARVSAGLASADAVVAPSASFRDALAVCHPGTEAAVIPNGADAPAPGDAQRVPVVLAAGRLWDEAKNLALLVTAAERLPGVVRVAGEGTAAPGVTWLGRLETADLHAEMAHAAVFAHPARYEPFGLAPLEAARAGCALVLGDIPSLREVWGDAATFVPCDDATALADACAALLDDPVRRHAAAGDARARAERYTMARTAGRHLDLYRTLLASR
jgi:glycogen(starch) synthase